MAGLDALYQLLGLTPPQRPQLMGLDPRFLKDPRFDVQSGINPQGQVFIESKGEGVTAPFRKGKTVTYLADVDDETLADDMWAVTAGGHTGTSEGDRSSNWFIQNAKDIVGDSKNVTANHLAEMRKRLLLQRYGEIRQTHPGLGGYTPKGLRY